jgi:hypothetical protein
MAPAVTPVQAAEIGLKLIGLLQLGLCLGLLPVFLARFTYGGASAFPTAFSVGLWFLAYGVGSALALFWRGLRWSAPAAFAWQVTALGTMLARTARADFDSVDSRLPVLVTLMFLCSTAYLGRRVVADARAFASRDPVRAARALRAATVPAALLLGAAGAYAYSWKSVPGLTWRLRSGDRDTSCMAARRLGRMGPAAARALPAFVPMLERHECSTIGEAADNPMEDLERIGGLDAALSVMRAGGPRARRAAALHVRLNARRHPDRWSDVRAAFLMGLQDPDPITRWATLTLIEQAGLMGADLLPDVRPLLNDAEPNVRAMAHQVARRFD